MKTLEFHTNKLVITIPTDNPAAYHSNLMQSVLSTMQLIAQIEERPKFFEDTVCPLLGFCKLIMPDESELKKIFSC